MKYIIDKLITLQDCFKLKFAVNANCLMVPTFCNYKMQHTQSHNDTNIVALISSNLSLQVSNEGLYYRIII